MSPLKTACLAGVLGAALHAAQAQQPPASAASAASAPSAAPQPSTYQSAFEGYRRYADEKVLPWKEANDRVGRIGGWRAYAKEAAGTAPQTSAAPAASQPAAPAGHSKHH